MVVVAGLTTMLPAVEVAVVQVAEHESVLSEVHERVEFCPLSIVDGFAVRETVGLSVPPLPPPLVMVITRFSPSLPH